MKDKKIDYKKLRDSREDKNLTQKEMAAKLNIEQAAYSRIENGTKKLVFIHGVGNGRLKMEIQNALKATRGVTFQDASYKLYGFCATQVNIL